MADLFPNRLDKALQVLSEKFADRFAQARAIHLQHQVHAALEVEAERRLLVQGRRRHAHQADADEGGDDQGNDDDGSATGHLRREG